MRIKKDHILDIIREEKLLMEQSALVKRNRKRRQQRRRDRTDRNIERLTQRQQDRDDREVHDIEFGEIDPEKDIIVHSGDDPTLASVEDDSILFSGTGDRGNIPSTYSGLYYFEIDDLTIPLLRYRDTDAWVTHLNDDGVYISTDDLGGGDTYYTIWLLHGGHEWELLFQEVYEQDYRDRGASGKTIMKGGWRNTDFYSDVPPGVMEIYNVLQGVSSQALRQKAGLSDAEDMHESQQTDHSARWSRLAGIEGSPGLPSTVFWVW